MMECPPQVEYPPLEKMTPEGEIHCWQTVPDCQNFLQWWNGPIGKMSPTGRTSPPLVKKAGRAAFWAYLL